MDPTSYLLVGWTDEDIPEKARREFPLWSEQAHNAGYAHVEDCNCHPIFGIGFRLCHAGGPYGPIDLTDKIPEAIARLRSRFGKEPRLLLFGTLG